MMPHGALLPPAGRPIHGRWKAAMPQRAQYDRLHMTWQLSLSGLWITAIWPMAGKSEDNQSFWHDGGTGGYSTMLIIDPENKRAAFANNDTPMWTSDLAQALFDEI